MMRRLAAMAALLASPLLLGSDCGGTAGNPADDEDGNPIWEPSVVESAVDAGSYPLILAVSPAERVLPATVWLYGRKLGGSGSSVSVSVINLTGQAPEVTPVVKYVSPSRVKVKLKDTGRGGVAGTIAINYLKNGKHAFYASTAASYVYIARDAAALTSKRAIDVRLVKWGYQAFRYGFQDLDYLFQSCGWYPQKHLSWWPDPDNALAENPTYWGPNQDHSPIWTAPKGYMNKSLDDFAIFNKTVLSDTKRQWQSVCGRHFQNGARTAGLNVKEDVRLYSYEMAFLDVDYDSEELWALANGYVIDQLPGSPLAIPSGVFLPAKAIPGHELLWGERAAITEPCARNILLADDAIRRLTGTWAGADNNKGNCKAYKAPWAQSGITISIHRSFMEMGREVDPLDAVNGYRAVTNPSTTLVAIPIPNLIVVSASPGVGKSEMEWEMIPATSICTNRMKHAWSSFHDDKNNPDV